MLLLFTDKSNMHRFGMIHLLLQLIPVFSMLFLLTTAAGAALWAADLELELNPDRDQPVDRDIAEPPPPYEDDPI
jgi:hypothetical protein